METIQSAPIGAKTGVGQQTKAQRTPGEEASALSFEEALVNALNAAADGRAEKASSDGGAEGAPTAQKAAELAEDARGTAVLPVAFETDAQGVLEKKTAKIEVLANAAAVLPQTATEQAGAKAEKAEKTKEPEEPKKAKEKEEPADAAPAVLNVAAPLPQIDAGAMLQRIVAQASGELKAEKKAAPEGAQAETKPDASIKISVDLGMDSKSQAKSAEQIKDEREIGRYTSILNALKADAPKGEAKTEFNPTAALKEETESAPERAESGKEANAAAMPEIAAGAGVPEAQKPEAPAAGSDAKSLPELKDFARKEIGERLEMKQTGTDKIELQLRPEKLGKIEIVFEKREGELHVHMKVEEREAKAYGEQMMQDLKHELKERGVKIEYQVEERREERKEKRKEEREQPKKGNKREHVEEISFLDKLQESVGG